MLYSFCLCNTTVHVQSVHIVTLHIFVWLLHCIVSISFIFFIFLTLKYYYPSLKNCMLLITYLILSYLIIHFIYMFPFPSQHPSSRLYRLFLSPAKLNILNPLTVTMILLVSVPWPWPEDQTARGDPPDGRVSLLFILFSFHCILFCIYGLLSKLHTVQRLKVPPPFVPRETWVKTLQVSNI